jgi:hypothetical protein
VIIEALLGRDVDVCSRIYLKGRWEGVKTFGKRRSCTDRYARGEQNRTEQNRTEQNNMHCNSADIVLGGLLPLLGVTMHYYSVLFWGLLCTLSSAL